MTRRDVLPEVLPFVREVRRTRSDPRAPLVLGLTGPQGCGKSTLAEGLRTALLADGLRAVTLSLDDLYLTRAEQVALSARHPGNPYLAMRGYPGTHDVDLGVRVLDDLIAGRPTALPRYDKGAFAGRGDRRPVEAWTSVGVPTDVVIFEGWMLGFVPVPDEAVSDEALRVPNRALARYPALWSRLGALVFLDVSSDDRFVAWRVQAEQERRRTGPGMSDDEARAYAEAFRPAYAMWTPGLRAHWPIAGPCVRIVIA